MIRLVLSQGVWILLVVFLIWGWQIRYELFPSLKPVDKPEPVAMDLQVERGPAPYDGEMPEVTVPATESAPLKSLAPEAAPVQPPQSEDKYDVPPESEGTFRIQPVGEAIMVPDPVAEPKPVKKLDEPTDGSDQPLENEPQSKTSPAPSEPKAMPFPGIAEETAERMGDVLAKARSAYWNRQYHQAELLYQQALERFPEVADIQGELGNLLYRQGRMTEATDRYLAALRAQLQRGQQTRVEYLLKHMKGVNPNLANELQMRLSQDFRR